MRPRAARQTWLSAGKPSVDVLAPCSARHSSLNAAAAAGALMMLAAGLTDAMLSLTAARDPRQSQRSTRVSAEHKNGPCYSLRNPD